MNDLFACRFARAVAVLPVALALGACGAVDRIASIGAAPPMTTIQNPKHGPNYRPVTMPMPRPQPTVRHANSLWRTGARSFFEDQRAAKVGDILTVMIEINDKANISNTTTRSRKNSEDVAGPALLGFESRLNRILPQAVNPDNLVELGSESLSRGAGSVKRDEKIELKVAAVVTQVLPNGNMVLHGRQEVRVNFEVRELQIAGVIRPEDISNRNTISYDKIAEARISYGGRGHITDYQQPRYGQQFLDVVLPF